MIYFQNEQYYGRCFKCQVQLLCKISRFERVIIQNTQVNWYLEFRIVKEN